MILDTLALAAQKRVMISKESVSMEAVTRMAYEAAEKAAAAAGPFVFHQALSSPGLSFICEVKKASPSKGIISPDFPYMKIAGEYEEAGADAISVLTEPEYFLGKNEYLTEISKNTALPLLRKDFTVDPYQIYEARAIGASAVLLICALLDTKRLKDAIGICDSLGLCALVEAHDEKEIDSALEAGARIIGVNNRNLKNFTVDFDNCLKLRAMVPPEVLFVAESGVKTKEDVRRISDAGVNAVLIGETLMRSKDKKGLFMDLKRACGRFN